VDALLFVSLHIMNKPVTLPCVTNLEHSFIILSHVIDIMCYAEFQVGVL